MNESKAPRLAVAVAVAATSFMSPSSSSPSLLSSLSPSHSSSSSLSKSSPSTISPCPPKPPFSLLRKRKATKWVSRLFRLHKLSMEAADEGLLLHPHSQGLHGSWGDADQHKVDEKPKRELRFAAKIAAAMDADGFIGVKDSVCAEDTPVGIQQSMRVKNVENLYCGPSPANLQRAPLKQVARPRRRRWRFLRRFRRTRVLFSCMLQKVKRAFARSSKRSLQVRDGLIK